MMTCLRLTVTDMKLTGRITFWDSELLPPSDFFDIICKTKSHFCQLLDYKFNLGFMINQIPLFSVLSLTVKMIKTR